MTKQEIDRAMQVLGAHNIFDTVQQMNRRMDTLEDSYITPVQMRLSEIEATQRELSERLSDVEEWIDGSYAKQMDMLLASQMIVMEKLDELLGQNGADLDAFEECPGTGHVLLH